RPVGGRLPGRAAGAPVRHLRRRAAHRALLGGADPGPGSPVGRSAPAELPWVRTHGSSAGAERLSRVRCRRLPAAAGRGTQQQPRATAAGGPCVRAPRGEPAQRLLRPPEPPPAPRWLPEPSRSPEPPLSPDLAVSPAFPPPVP